MARGGIPQATMRFMPLADIFIGAIACLLILIIVAKQARETTSHVPQADLVLACHPAASTAQQSSKPAFRPIIIAPEKYADFNKDKKNSLKDLLRQIAMPSRLTTRILLHARPEYMDCIAQMRTLIRHLNRQYETPSVKNRPRSYLLLDVEYLPANMEPKEIAPN